MTTQTATQEREAPQQPRQLREVGEFVHTRVTELQRGYFDRRSGAIATLAQLRRGVGREVGTQPELWQVTLDGLPPPRRDDAPPTAQERAAHTAITLYAVHQQSRREEMHRRGQGLGSAVRKLCNRAPSADAVRRRFEALGTAETFAEAVNHARGLITQLRAYSIPLDYGAFADDLYWLRTGRAGRVRLAWGRDFYRGNHTNRPDESATENASVDQASRADAQVPKQKEQQ